ncbi:MAG: hypothetical protein GC151_09780 [Betaproteobacteria bacterium]|nr:hypothetical protein [Betaproteobacteria bacterium]
MAREQPGRACPLHYRYAPESFAAAPSIGTDVLYVVGGLYGNPFALDAVLALAARERTEPLIVFNGDFHWFDVDPGVFERVDRAVSHHERLRGNVETELAGDDDAAGCGCAYPEWVGDAEVDRSNRILLRLRDAARRFPARLEALAALPMWRVADVGGIRIGIVHGDAWSLSGWAFSQERLADDPRAVQRAIHAAGVHVFASSHTCLPVLLNTHAGVLVNNGAAGMPNFTGTRFGIITRIATRDAPEPALYGVERDGVRIEALPLHYDAPAWIELFDAQWPPGSPAQISYRERIVSGPRYVQHQAMRTVG